MTLAIVDGDVYKHRYASACEYDMFEIKDSSGIIHNIRTKTAAKKFLKEDTEAEILSEEHILDPVEWCLHSIKISIEDIIEKYGGPLKIYIGHGKNFRHEIYPEYKANRKEMGKPAHYYDVVDYLKLMYNAEIVEGIEADDAITIEATANKDSVICSPDKDLDQVSGKHYDFTTKRMYTVTPKEADYNLFRQVISGDATDNIKGIKGVGTKTAEAKLVGSNNIQELWDRTKKAYKGDVGSALFTGNLVFLHRIPGDYFEAFLKRNKVTI